MAFSVNYRARHLQALRGIIMGRWFLIFGVVFMGLLQTLFGIEIMQISLPSILMLAAVPILYNALFTIYIVRPTDELSDRMLHGISFSQILVDQFVFTVIIYLAGGAESIGFVLYFFPLLAATILYSDIEIISLAGFSIILYVSMIVMEYAGIIPHIARFSPETGVYLQAEYIVSNTIFFSIVLLCTALFAVFINRIIHDREIEITIERDKIRSIINSLDDGIIMLDAQHRVLLINRPAREMLSLHHHLTTPTLPLEEIPTFIHPLVEVIHKLPERKTFRQEVRIQQQDDNQYYSVDSIPIMGASGRPIGWVQVMRDTTREKELDEIKSDFISVAAHQLRTPLAALKWFFKIMEDGDAGEVTPRQAELLGEAYQRNNEVIEIVNNLLNISEIEEGRFPYEYAEVDIIEVIEATIETAHAEAMRKNVAVVLKNSVRNNPSILMDKQKMKMAIQNLVDNAVKYSPNDSTVEIGFQNRGEQYLLTITDKGIGIPNDQKRKIFSKFFRGRNAKEWATTGSGLGLYIVKNIVHKHRGQIWFESKEGEGTTFFVSLPSMSAYHGMDE